MAQSTNNIASLPRAAAWRRGISWIALLGFFCWGCATSEVMPPRPTGSPSGQSTGPVARRTPPPPDRHPEAPRPYQVFGKWYQPLAHAKGFRQRGIASWYGEAFHGRPTSSGEVYDMYRISAAHKVLPLGTYVRVRHLANGRTLDVQINDRGPFVAGRIIDLSYAAAQRLGIVEPGTAPVEIVALGVPARTAARSGKPQRYTPVDYYRGRFTIQVGAFRSRENAEKLQASLQHRSYRHAHIRSYFSHRGDETLHRVMVGRCTTLGQAQRYETILRQHGFDDAFMVAE